MFIIPIFRVLSFGLLIFKSSSSAGTTTEYLAYASGSTTTGTFGYDIINIGDSDVTAFQGNPGDPSTITAYVVSSSAAAISTISTFVIIAVSGISAGSPPLYTEVPSLDVSSLSSVTTAQSQSISSSDKGGTIPSASATSSLFSSTTSSTQSSQSSYSTTSVLSSTSISSGSAAATGSSTDIVVPGEQNPNRKTLYAIIGVIAALFLAALFAFFLVVLRLRKARRSTAYYADEPHIPPHSDKMPQGVSVTSVDSNLAAANAQIVDLQAALLTAGHKKPTKDDNTIVREWTAISVEIKAFANEFFKSTTNIASLTSAQHQFYSSEIPEYNTMLTSGKLKILVVRSIVSSVLKESLQKNEFFRGSVFSTLEPIVRNGNDAASFNGWRSETCMLLDKSPEFQTQRSTAVETITNKIEGLIFPLASTKQAYQADPARYRFLTERIVERMAIFATDLGKQRANFQVISKAPGTPFAGVEMEDVTQQLDAVQMEGGRSFHEADGRPVKMTVYPLLVKHGNESGEGYERATVIAKAQVLV